MDYEKIAVEILEKVTGADGLDEDKDLNLFDAGLMDSMAVINIILELESSFGLKMEPTDFTRENISSVSNFAKTLTEKSIEG